MKQILFDYLVELQVELASIDTFCNDLPNNDNKEAIYIALKNIENIIRDIEQDIIYKKEVF